LLVDLAETTGVEFAPLSESTKAAIATVIEPGLAPENPLDAWGTGNSSDEIYQTCALALDGDPQTGLTLFAVDLTRGSTLPPTYPDIILPIQHRLTKPLAFLVNISAGASDSMMKQLRDAGIPVLMGTETGLRAVRHLLAYAQFQRQMAGDRPQAANEAFTINRSQFTLHNSLDEYASKVLLAKYGIPVTREAIAVTAAEALQAAQKIGYPVALKTAVSHYQHKSEVNGIHLNLQNAKEVARAYDDLAARLGSRVLVQEMAPSGVELILGMVNDAQFGPMLVIGMGGVLVEVMRDSKLLLLPTTETAVRQALLSLRGAKLLQGVRGRPAVDVEAVVVAAMKLAALTADYAHTLAAIDINPLIVHTNGAIAVDALVIPNLEPRK
jgi:acyl-CoA synthetase (NDP forming)